MSQIVDPLLQNELKAGEQLLWWGRPDVSHRAPSTSTSTARVAYISYGILAVLALIFIIVIAQLLRVENTYPFLSDIRLPSLTLLIAVLFLLIFTGYRAYVTHSQQKRPLTQLRNTVYGITDQRIVVVIRNKQGFSVNSYTRDEIGQMNRVETGEGWGDVTFGKVRQVQRGLNSVFVAEKLVGIPDARGVEDLLRKTFKSLAPASQQNPAQVEETPQTASSTTQE